MAGASGKVAGFLRQGGRKSPCRWRVWDGIYTPSVEQLKRLAVLYNASLDYIMGMDDRSALYLDDLTDSQQKTVLDIVDRLKEEFKGGKALKDALN